MLILYLAAAIAHSLGCPVCHTTETSPDSKWCLVCHDGVTATDVGTVTHPVGVPEDAATDLPLPGGLVECLTCHDPHSGAVRGDGDLCTKCHQY